VVAGLLLVVVGASIGLRPLLMLLEEEGARDPQLLPMLLGADAAASARSSACS